MTAEVSTMRRLFQDRRGERGQILVLFTLAIFVIIGMVGLVLDGGSAFAQRRDEQNVADMAAVAGATAYLNSAGGVTAKTAAADAAARAVAAANGYVANAATGVQIGVTVTAGSASANVRVDLGKPHQNNFAGVLGMPTWGVGVDATAQSSEFPNGALGAMPLLFNAEAFPGAVCDETAGACVPEVYQMPGTGNQDVPQDATQFNWTVFCTASGNTCNGDSSEVDDLIHSAGTDTVIYIDDDIGPLNAGSHTTLFNDLQAYAGGTFPVPIVTDAGEMVGWAYFRLLSIEGAPEKVLRGYFVSPVNASQLVVSNNHGHGTLNTGVFILKLID